MKFQSRVTYQIFRNFETYQKVYKYKIEKMVPKYIYRVALIYYHDIQLCMAFTSNGFAVG